MIVLQDIDVRDNIRTVMEDKCYSHVLIAKRANLQPSQFSRILTKKRKLGADELYRICDALNMSPTELRDYHSIYNDEVSRNAIDSG